NIQFIPVCGKCAVQLLFYRLYRPVRDTEKSLAQPAFDLKDKFYFNDNINRGNNSHKLGVHFRTYVNRFYWMHRLPCILHVVKKHYDYFMDDFLFNRSKLPSLGFIVTLPRTAKKVLYKAEYH